MELQAQAAARMSAHRERYELVGLNDGVRPADELIEELMKTSNEVAAQFLDGQKFPVIFQTLGPPQRWDRIVILAERRRYQLPQQPDSGALVDFLKAQKARLDAESYGELALSIEKLLGRTYYAVKEAGKPFPEDFQLSLYESTRSTSPCVVWTVPVAASGMPDASTDWKSTRSRETGSGVGRSTSP